MKTTTKRRRTKYIFFLLSRQPKRGPVLSPPLPPGTLTCWPCSPPSLLLSAGSLSLSSHHHRKIEKLVCGSFGGGPPGANVWECAACTFFIKAHRLLRRRRRGLWSVELSDFVYVFEFFFLSNTRPVIISLKGPGKLQAQVQRFFYLSALEDCRHSGAHPFSQLQDSSILLRPFNFLLFPV